MLIYLCTKVAYKKFARDIFIFQHEILSRRTVFLNATFLYLSNYFILFNKHAFCNVLHAKVAIQIS